MTLDEIRERMEAIRDEMTELHGQEELTDEDTTRFEDLSAEFDQLETVRDHMATRNESIEKVRAAIADPRNVVSGADRTDPLGEPGSLDNVRTDDQLWDRDALRTDQLPELRAKAIDAIDRTRGWRGNVGEQATRFVESLDLDDDDVADANRAVLRHIVAVSDPAYMRAFGRYLKAGLKGRNAPSAEDHLQRAMSLTDAAGGYAVPLPVDPTLNITGDGSSNPFRQISRVVPIVTDKLRSVSAGATAFSFDAEAAEVSDDTSTFANVDITAHKAQGFIPYSIEAGQDIPNFTAMIAALMAEGRDDLEATKFAVGAGDGSNEPFGIVTAKTATTLASAATDTFAVGDVYTLIDTLGAKYDDRASFVANKAIYSLVRQFDTTGGTDLWVRLGQGQPPELLGYPAYRASGMDASVTATQDNYIMVLGDFSNYWIANRIGFSVEVIPHLLATANNLPSGQRGVYGYWRVGANAVNTDAFEMLNVT